MSPEPHNSVEVFYSYAHEDEELRNELKKHLSNLKRQGVITEWYDRDISAGTEWGEEIKQYLESAKVILLLISPDFMNSDYINDIEVKRAMERHESGEARVIPVILRPVDWEGAPFSKLQALPTEVRPITLWSNRDEAFLDVIRGIRAALHDLSNLSLGIPATLDIPSPSKVGFISRRDRDNLDFIERVRTELVPGKSQLVVLWGGGGVGKTAIAAEAVRGLIEPFAKRIAWVSADGLESFSLATLLDGVATQLGHSDLRKLPLDLKKEQVRDLVKTSPTLIVLDNFETIERAERVHCVDWLGKPAPCTALITTRDGIEDARNIPIDVMRPEEANGLVDQLIAQTHEARAFAKLDRERIIQIAEANPLVLQWIVGQIDLAQDPDEVLDDLQHGEGKAADRVFNRSYELKQLNNGGRAVLLALSLFAPSATRKAVAEVANIGKDSDRRKFRDAIRSLSSLWLIHTADENHRLAVEGLTRKMTKAKLDVDPRGKVFPTRFLSRFLGYAQKHKKPSKENYDALESEKDNLLTAVDIARALGATSSALNLAYILASPGDGVLRVRGYWNEALRIGRLALETARAAQVEKHVAGWSHNVALMCQEQGDFDEARRLYSESLKFKVELGGETAKATTLHQLGMMAHHRGDLEEAHRLYQQSLDSVDVNERAATLHQLAKLAQEQGQFAEAEQLFNDSLQIDRRIGSDRGITINFCGQGSLAQEQGKFTKARQLYQQGLSIAQKLGDQLWIASYLHQLGTLHFDEGDLEASQDLLQSSFDILWRLGDKMSSAECLESLGKLRVAQGHWDMARTLFDKALRIAEKIGISLRIASIKHSLGLLAEKQGDKARASELLGEALPMFEQLRSPKAKDAQRDLERIEGKSS